MATVISTARNSTLRSIAIGGIIIAILQTIYQWIVVTVMSKVPFIIIFQYIASGVLGESAFEGGITTGIIGFIFHLIISFAVAGIFILSAERIPVLRRYPIPAALLYGFVVWLVMNLIVVPLSAAPPADTPPTSQIIGSMVDHILVIGLTLGMLVQRNTNQ